MSSRLQIIREFLPKEEGRPERHTPASLQQIKVPLQTAPEVIPAREQQAKAGHIPARAQAPAAITLSQGLLPVTVTQERARATQQPSPALHTTKHTVAARHTTAAQAAEILRVPTGHRQRNHQAVTAAVHHHREAVVAATVAVHLIPVQEVPVHILREAQEAPAHHTHQEVREVHPGGALVEVAADNRKHTPTIKQ